MFSPTIPGGGIARALRVALQQPRHATAATRSATKRTALVELASIILTYTVVRENRPDILLWSLLPLALLTIYLAAYLVSTEVFHGRLGGTRYRIRLFCSESHQRIFRPLLTVEQQLRPADPEFSGQVRSGASLPQPDEEASPRSTPQHHVQTQ